MESHKPTWLLYLQNVQQTISKGYNSHENYKVCDTCGLCLNYKLS